MTKLKACPEGGEKIGYLTKREIGLVNGIWRGKPLEELDDSHVYNLVWYLINHRGSVVELKAVLKENKRRKQKHPLDGVLRDDFKMGYHYEERHNV